MPPGVTFTRASTANYTDIDGNPQTAAANEPRFEANGLLIQNAALAGAAESLTTTDLSWFASTEGTFVVEFRVPSLSGTAMYAFQMRGSTDSNRHFIRFAATSGQMQSLTVTDGAVQAQLLGGNISANAVHRVAYAYKLNDFGACQNGGTVLTDTAGSVPLAGNLVRLAIGSTHSGTAPAEHLNGWMRRLRFYPARVTNAELQALTAAPVALTASDLTASAPALDSPALESTGGTTAHELAASGLASSAPALASPTIAQRHQATASGLASGSPTMGAPAITTAAPENSALEAAALVAGSPALASPALAAVHGLAAAAVALAEPVAGSPGIAQAHGLTAAAIARPAPALASPSITQAHALTSQALAAGAPAAGLPVLNGRLPVASPRPVPAAALARAAMAAASPRGLAVPRSN